MDPEEELKQAVRTNLDWDAFDAGFAFVHSGISEGAGRCPFCPGPEGHGGWVDIHAREGFVDLKCLDCGWSTTWRSWLEKGSLYESGGVGPP